MTMPNHPDDERLAALAGADPDATGDRELRAHVAACPRCGELTTDLTRLLAALAELPDIAPAHVLRFDLPPESAAVPRSAARAAGGGAPAGGFLDTLRRALVPAMVAGAALALVGAVGTSGYLDGAMTGGEVGLPAAVPEAAEMDSSSGGSGSGQDGGGTQVAIPYATTPNDTAELLSATDGASRTGEGGDRAAGGAQPLWLVRLVGGVTIVAGALVLRATLRRPAG